MPPAPMPQNIVNAIKDDNFWKGVKALKEAGDKIMPEVTRASHKCGRFGTLDQRIEERSAFARMGVKLADIGGSALLVKGIVPLSRPPVQNGMMYCVDLVEKIVRKDYGRAGIAYLLKRIRHLLRVFYNFTVGQRMHPDLMFCDWEKMFDVGLTLHQVGLCLQLDPPRLRAIMAGGGPELEAFLVDDELDIGDFRKAAVLIEKRVAADVESEDADRIAAGEIEDRAEDDLAAHVVSWFYGNLSVAFILNENDQSDVDEKRWARKALARLVHWSTSSTCRLALGDPITDAMRPIYWSKPALTKFSQAGGLAALFGDWVNSSCIELCAKALEKLPDAAWEHQTPASLRAVTRELQLKLNSESSQIATTAIFVAACFNMHTRYGLAPFQRAAKCVGHGDPVLFHYVAHHIKRDALPMGTLAAWRALLGAYVAMPRATEERYEWMTQTISGRWDCLEFYGCEYGEHPDSGRCPEQKALVELRERRVRGVRDAAVEARLERWGSKLPACAACGTVAYCSPTCQRAHWPEHKPKCLKQRKDSGRT
ncbi:hypothetical protein C8R43DRAFT_1186165 [Mycena crocata]|nr:hypothetical protein C8R43DRAFT_1186165 [Mycena crocata]